MLYSPGVHPSKLVNHCNGDVQSACVSHCFSVSLSGDWESAEDLDQLLSGVHYALHNNIGMAMLIVHSQLGVVMPCNCEIELHVPLELHS